MTRWMRVGTMAVGLATLAASPAAPADDAAVTRDLTAVIALQGLPCGEVTAVARQADNDYLATCANGARYRVFLSPQGRVVVQAQ